jgi:glycosyltransferase involved in cell wall biosynthesis
LKILIVTGIYPPDIGGPANFTPEISKFLASKGHSTQVLTLSDELNPLGKSESKVRRIQRKGRVIRRLKTVFWIIRYGKSADKILVTGLYEEVGLASLFLNASIVMRIVGDPIWERARNAHSTTENIEEFNKSDSGPTFQRKFLSWAINRGHLCITPSEQLRDFIIRWKITCRIKVIPNGVSIPEITREIPDYRGITVSRLVSWKNVSLVIETAIKCGLPLRIVGDGPLEGQLKSYESDGVIQLLGRKNKVEVSDLLRDSSIFFLLSSYEGQSFALTEALANGLFCVVSDIPGNMQLIKHLENGFVFKLSDQETSTAELGEVLSDKILVNAISARARKYAILNLDSKVIANQLMEELANL